MGKNGTRQSGGTAKRVLRVVARTLIALVMALYIGYPLALAVAVVWPARADVGEPPAGFEDVRIPCEDGVDLAAWYAAPDNGVAVIVVHGAGGSRERMRRQAELLVRHGYGVLALDLRGHGESEARTNRLGWEGTRDIRAAVDFLQPQDDVEAIAALGSSMGGEVLLGASAECPEIRAIITDGATRRSTGELLSLPSERPLVRNFTARVMYSAVRVLSATPEPDPLFDETLKALSTRFLFIAAGDDPLEVAFNQMFADALGDRAELWVAPQVRHTGALTRYPDEYERRVTEFLAEVLATPAE